MFLNPFSDIQLQNGGFQLLKHRNLLFTGGIGRECLRVGSSAKRLAERGLRHAKRNIHFLSSPPVNNIDGSFVGVNDMGDNRGNSLLFIRPGVTFLTIVIYSMPYLMVPKRVISDSNVAGAVPQRGASVWAKTFRG